MAILSIKKIVDFEADGETPIKVIQKYISDFKIEFDKIMTFSFEVVPNIVEVDK